MPLMSLTVGARVRSTRAERSGWTGEVLAVSPARPAATVLVRWRTADGGTAIEREDAGTLVLIDEGHGAGPGAHPHGDGRHPT